MYSLALLLLGILALGSVPLPGPAAIEVVRVMDGPAIAVHRQPGVPIVSLRMSILAPDPAGYAGVGHMIQHAIYPALQERVSRIGGTVNIQRTSDAIVYTVTGPAVEIEYMADLMISALQPPQAPVDVILRAERELREERLAEWETAPAHTRSFLRAQVFPADLSAAGTDRSATRFSSTTLPAIWADLYDPERVSVVAVGDVYLGDVIEAFEGLPAAFETPRLGMERDSVVLTSLAPAQATQGWFGNAYLATDLPPAAVNVATRMLGDLIRDRLPTAQVEPEHWWTHHGQAIALIVAVPGPEMAAARRAMGTAVSTLLDEATSASVAHTANAIRREMLFYARTPDRMAEVIGQFIDREGDPHATDTFFADLERVDVEAVRAVLERIRERTPARVEIPPQALRPRGG